MLSAEENPGHDILGDVLFPVKWQKEVFSYNLEWWVSDVLSMTHEPDWDSVDHLSSHIPTTLLLVGPEPCLNLDVKVGNVSVNIFFEYK